MTARSLRGAPASARAVFLLLALLLVLDFCRFGAAGRTWHDPSPESGQVTFFESLNVCDGGGGCPGSTVAKFCLPENVFRPVYRTRGNPLRLTISGRLSEGHPREIFRPPRPRTSHAAASGNLKSAPPGPIKEKEVC